MGGNEAGDLGMGIASMDGKQGGMTRQAEKGKAMSEKRQIWCDACHRPLDDGKVSCYYDARTSSGQWGYFCHACFQALGCKLGTGLGQKFDAKTGVKIAG